MAMGHSDKAWKEGQVLSWALAHPRCTITEIPSWVILILLEDITRWDCQLLEHLVMALDHSQGIVMAESHLERAVQTLMTNVLLSSLHEDGYIELASRLFDEPRFFDFHSPHEVQITLTPSGQAAHLWEELELFSGSYRGSFQ
jgi:hypothetical protein